MDKMAWLVLRDSLYHARSCGYLSPLCVTQVDCILVHTPVAGGGGGHQGTIFYPRSGLADLRKTSYWNGFGPCVATVMEAFEVSISGYMAAAQMAYPNAVSTADSLTHIISTPCSSV